VLVELMQAWGLIMGTGILPVRGSVAVQPRRHPRSSQTAVHVVQALSIFNSPYDITLAVGVYIRPSILASPTQHRSSTTWVGLLHLTGLLLSLPCRTCRYTSPELHRTPKCIPHLSAKTLEVVVEVPQVWAARG
jgi:hypothetical protein